MSNFASPPPAPAPSRPRLFVLVVVLSAVAVLGFVAIAGFLAIVLAERGDEPETRAVAVAPPAKPAASTVPARVATTVVAPDKLGGKARNTGLPAETFDEFAKFGLTSTVSAAYGDLQSESLVVAAIAVTKGTPQERFDRMLAQAKKELGGTTNEIGVEPGPNGGRVSCADVIFNGTLAGICVWSDDTTSGTILGTLMSGQVLSQHLAGYRAQIETPV